MGRYIIKAEKDVDFYVEWSTIVENWVSAGTRQEMLDGGITEVRLDKADSLGSSYDLSCGRWGDQKMLVHNLPDKLYEGVEGYYTLPRENLIKFVYATDENGDVDSTAIRELLVLNEWD